MSGLRIGLSATAVEPGLPGRRRLRNWLLAKGARKADHVIALSRHAVPELVRGFGVDERRALRLTWAETARRTAAVYQSILTR